MNVANRTNVALPTKQPEAPNRPALVAPAGAQRIGAFTELPALIRQLGADPDALLAAAGLAPDALDRPDRTVAYAALGRLFARVAEATGCPQVGLLAGRMWHLSDLGLVGEIVRHSPTLGDALRTLTVYQHLNSGGGLAFLLERGGAVDLGYAIYEPRVEGAAALFDSALAAGQNTLAELAGPGFVATEVQLPHVRPHDVSPYRACFHIVPRFESEMAVIRFPAALMAQPIRRRPRALP